MLFRLAPSVIVVMVSMRDATGLKTLLLTDSETTINMLNTLALRLSLIAITLMILPLQASLPDRLNQPAPMSDAAHSVLLTDITRVQDRLLAIGDFGVVLYSDNEGIDWQQANVPVTTLLTSIYFSSETVGWISGHDGVLLRSDNAGKDWQLHLDGNQIHELKINHYQAQLDALTASDRESDPLLEDDLLFALEDAEFYQEEGPVNPLLQVWFQDSQVGFLLGAYGLALRTQDGGNTWVVMSDDLPNPDQFHLNAITAQADSLVIAGEAGLLMKSDDQGESWYALPSPYTGSFFDVVSHQQSLFVLGLRGHLFRSDDGGFDWQAQEVDTTVSFMGAYSDQDSLAVAGLGGTLLTGSEADKLELKPLGVRRHFNAVVATTDGWVLVGEQGIFRSSEQGVSQ